ncbi:MAG: hypothetical protein COA70_05885 [Planctomycetota bacterium]|nr:MAG: hypothetical protein COA70_05885 [Planctomycetota bacterium]
MARFTADGKKPRSSRLCRLLQMAVAGDGELLRLSARRSVFRLKDQGADWILKLDAPERSFEAIRARLRRPPLARESRNWKLLCERWPELQPILGVVDAEQIDAARGCFARQWFAGRRGNVWTVEDSAAVGSGMATLHQLGWTDVDLSPDDLLLDDCNRLLPLDLGHAHVGNAPSAASDRCRDWVHLLGGFCLNQRREFASPMLAAYRSAQRLRESDAEIMRQALLWTSAILHRQSRRCLRETRDFTPKKNGIVRCEGIPQGEGSVVEGNSSSSAQETFRMLYELELHGVAALRPVKLQMADSGDWVIEGVIPEPSATLQADLLAAGYAMEENNADGIGFIHDPRGLQRVKPKDTL